MGNNCSCLRSEDKSEKVTYDYLNMIKKNQQSAPDQLNTEIDKEYEQELQSHIILDRDNQGSTAKIQKKTTRQSKKHRKKYYQAFQSPNQEAVSSHTLNIQIPKTQRHLQQQEEDSQINITSQCQIHLQCISRGYLTRKYYKPNKSPLQKLSLPKEKVYQKSSTISLPSTQAFYQLDKVFGKLELSPLNDGIETFWRPAVQFSNGTIYEGQWSENEPYGTGYQLEPNGNFFYGYFANGKKYLFGRLLMGDGSAYQGDFKSGKFHGKGLFLSRFGSLFICKFRKGHVDGYGQEKHTDGTLYEGNFKNGKREGQGKLIMKDGSVYIGDFANGFAQGKGQCVWPNQKKYEGEWKEGKMHGEGKLFLPDKSWYMGRFENDKKHGYGEFIWPDGRKYSGNWAHDQFDGIGELITVVNGQSFARKGKWLRGKRIAWID